jgi:arsenite-transporting ATPase
VVASRAGERVLAVSTDPAHSLGDALGVRLTSQPTRIGRSFAAVELDAPRAFARWLAGHRQALGDIVEHGTWLDREDVDALLGLSIPGIDELVGLIEIGRLAESRTYSLIIVDTAPTGHTLRLLSATDVVAAVAAVLDDMQREHRLIREQLARVDRPEAADRLIGMLADQARQTGVWLRDARRSAFHWVLLPEELSVAESEDGLAALDRAGVPVAEVIVNRVTPDGAACPICDRRRADERRVLAQVPRRLGRQRCVRIIPAQAREPRGIPALTPIGKQLTAPHSRRPGLPAYARGAQHASYGEARRSAVARRRQARRPGADLKVRTTTARAAAYSLSKRERTIAAESIDAFLGARLLLFGGKGGVGKTTCAAAAALRLARADPARRVLLLSTDPAHSLGDVFGVSMGNRPRSIPGAARNLRVRELDAPAALAARRADLEAALREIVATFAVEREASSGRGVSELMDLAPPGIDELLGVLMVVEAQKTYDLIVLDTAPTGHALRLLEMPDAAREWVQVLMRVLLKYRALVRPGQLGAELLELSKSIRRLQELLHDPVAARVIVVTRAAEVPRLETERLIDRLRRLHLAAPAVVVNAVTLAPGACARCRATAAAERVELAALRRRCRRSGRECVIILTPLAAPAPRGVAALDHWASTWQVVASRQSRVTSQSRKA